MIASGQLLAERYRLGTRIAVGGMGEVWQASDTRLDRTVAIKILKAELSSDAEFLHRFRTEARTTASLNHPGIAAVHDYGEAAADGGLSLAYLVMELVKGESLAEILAREGRIDAQRLLPLLEQAGRALQAAHERGLVHRDVKPGNILVSRAQDGTETVKLTDFGIAKAGHAAPVTRQGMVMGTAHYIAPEQATGDEAMPASDVYSLAVCGYECLVGHRPFLSENAVTVAMMHIRDTPPPLPPDVPPTVRALIERTLAKHPAQRYANGGEFAAAVAAVRAGHPPPLPVGLSRTPPGGTPVIGPPSHPSMHPVSPPSGVFAQPPAPTRRIWPWVVVGIIGTILVVTAAVLIPIMISDDDDGDVDNPGIDPTTGLPEENEQAPATGQPPTRTGRPDQRTGDPTTAEKPGDEAPEPTTTEGDGGPDSDDGTPDDQNDDASVPPGEGSPFGPGVNPGEHPERLPDGEREVES